MRPLALCLVAVLATACVHHAPLVPGAPAPRALDLFDRARRRPVPVLLYGAPPHGHARPLAVLSHGYGGHNGAYAFIAEALARRGYVVASIEHLERPGDPPMAAGGDRLAERRRPVWRIGADSIAFVIRELRARGLARHAKALLIGHSNGGDMTMLFAAEHPEQVSAAVSLDNRRMPLPRTSNPRICSIRSSDQLPDPGVLPAAAEQARLAMVIRSVAVRHDDMWDGAAESQKREMLAVVEACLDG